MEDRFKVFMAVWILLAIFSLAFQRFNKDVRLKQKIYPWTMIGMGIIFIFFTIWVGAPLNSLFFTVPSLILICFITIRNSRYCPKCGAFVYNWNWFDKVKYCSKCGAPL